MKKYIRIKVADQELDFDPNNLNLDLTFSITDKNDISNTQGSRSERSVTLPASKQNKSVLQNVKGLQTASIEVNGVPVLQGTAQRKENKQRGGTYQLQDKKYNVAFFGNNAGWFTLLKDKFLGTGLNYSDLVHDFDVVDIENGLFNVNASLQGYCYAVVKRTPFGGVSFVNAFECSPALYVAPLLTRIFNSVGYTIDSDFLESELAQSLILPVLLPEKYNTAFSEEYLNISAEKTITTAASANAQIIYDNQTKTPPNAPFNPYIASDATFPSALLAGGTTYTAPYDGFYEASVSIVINNVTVIGTQSPQLILVDGNGNGPVGNVFIPTLTDADRVIELSGIFQLNAGEKIAAGIINLATQYQYDITGGTFEVRGEALIKPNIPIDFKFLLQDWLITDFIKGVQHLFNLKFDTNDAARTVKIEPSDNWINTQPPATQDIQNGFYQGGTDITQRLDLSKDSRRINKVDVAESYLYKYRDPASDPTYEVLNVNEEIPVYGARYDLDTEVFNETTQDDENPFFAPTLHLLDTDIRAIDSDITPLVAIVWSNNYKESPNASEKVDTNSPRILIKPDPLTRADVDGKIQFSSATDPFGIPIIQVLNNPVAFAVNFNDQTGLEPSLSYSDVTVNNSVQFGLFRRFYLTQYSRINQAVQLECYIKYNTLDILQLNFAQKVVINNQRYILQEVESWSPLTNTTTKTTLLLDAAPNDSDAAKTINANQIGLLNILQ